MTHLAAGTPDRAPRAIEVSGPITSDALWDADTVRVVGDVTVADGVTLTIAAGVRVEAMDHYGLFVLGNLQAIGTPTEMIHLTSHDPEQFAIDSSTTGSWFGLRFPRTAATNDSSRLAYCILEYCKAAGDSSRGAALALSGFSKLRATNCVFQHNVADYGAAIYCSEFASPVINGCLITDNRSFEGGSAVYCLDSYPRLANNTIVWNSARNGAAFTPTAAIHNHISKSQPVNCVIRENESDYFLGGQILEGKFPYVRYNNIEDGHPGEGNFDADPLFVDSGPHPFALEENSPCIDAGSVTTGGLGLPPRDLAGTPRVWNGRIDVGAYEWAAPGAIPAEEPSGETAAEAATRISSLRVWPNPSAGAVALSLLSDRGGASGALELIVVDPSGRHVAVLRTQEITPGHHRAVWDGCGPDGRRVATGVYLCRPAEAGAGLLAKDARVSGGLPLSVKLLRIR